MSKDKNEIEKELNLKIGYLQKRCDEDCSFCPLRHFKHCIEAQKGISELIQTEIEE